MSGPGKDEERPKLERFDGSQPSSYRRWRRKAELMLLALPTTYTKDRWGAKLLEYVSGEAEEVCEGLALEKITKEDGHKLIFDALDGRYRELEKEALHNHLHEYFYELKIRPGESYRNMTVRLDTSYRRLQEHSVELPEEVRGWFLLQKLKLDQAAQALLLTSTKGSLKYSEINKAVQAIFPQGVAASTTGRTREVFSAEGDETMDIESENAEDVYEAIAEQFQLADEYEEEDALDVFETYKDIRRRVQEKKLGRGYKGHQDGDWKLSGTLKGKLELMKSKTRCHVCKELGHWKRECPKRTQQSGGRQTRAGGSNDAMVADDSGEGYKNLAEEHFLDIDEIEKYEIFLAERGGEIDVVVASKDEAIDQNDEVKGDFEHSLQQFFTSSAGSNRADVSEAYMAEFADLAEHGVPDTACRRTLIGQSVLQRMSSMLRKSGLKVRIVPECHEFKFGNAGVLKSTMSALIPVCFGGKQLAIRAAVLPGSGSETPLLLSKELLRSLHVKLDMGNDVLEVGKYGVRVKLKETERGHYALPLFTGLGGSSVKMPVIKNVHDKTKDVNAAEFSQCSRDVRALGGVSESKGHELRRTDGAGCADGVVHEDTAHHGAAERSVSSGIPGGAERLECQDSGRGSRSQRRRARRRRTRNSWVAGQHHIQRGQVPEGRATGELQDRVPDRQEVHCVGEKVHQGQVRPSHGENKPSYDDAVQAVCGIARPAQVDEAQGHERAGPSGATQPGAFAYIETEGKSYTADGIKGVLKQPKCGCDHKWGGSATCPQPSGAGARERRPVVAHASDGAISAGEPSRAPSAPDSRADREPDPPAGIARGERGAVSSEHIEAEAESAAVMSKAEKKLCRRGLESCSPDGGAEATGYGVDVMLLQVGSGEEVLTAVGLSVQAAFQELTSQDIRKPSTADVVLQKLRDLRPRLLVVQPPDHMTKTRGSKHIVRTYHARQRAAFTKLVSACCAEQMCEGRLFCIEDVNECMSERVSQWRKQRGDERVLCVERHESESSWRMFTNSSRICEEARKTWITQRELQDSRCFMKDIAAGLLRAKQDAAEVLVAQC